MAGKTTKVSVDENEIDKRRNIAAAKPIFITKEYAPKVLKRAVLGDLGNVASTSRGAGAIQKENFKHVKPRVDSHWEPHNKNKVAAELQKKLDEFRNNWQIHNEGYKRGEVKTKENPEILITKQREERKPNISRNKQKVPPTIETNFSCALLESHYPYTNSQIVDIDENKEDVHYVPDYAQDICDYMFKLEEKNVIREKYLAHHAEITPNMRTILLDWINETHYHFDLSVEAYFLTVALVDLYLQRHKQIKRINLQLVGCTAMFIASKYEEVHPPEIKDFVYSTDRTWNKKHICDMEQHILITVDFKMGQPLPIHFLRRFSAAAAPEKLAYVMAKYFIELISMEYSMVHLKKSLMAAASLYLSIHVCKNQKSFDPHIWTPTAEYYSTYAAEDLQPVAKKTIKLVRNASNTKYQGIFSRYSASSNMAIAKKLDSPDLKLLLHHLFISDMEPM